MTVRIKHTQRPAQTTHAAAVQVQQALALHQQGRLEDARRIYEAVLRIQPRQVDALHLLGVLAHQSNDPQRGVDLIARAIALLPHSAILRYNHGNALMSLGRPAQAAGSFRQAIRLQADHVDAMHHLGNALVALGQADEAVAIYDQALALAPRLPDIWYSRACALHGAGRCVEALASYDQVIALQPDHGRAYNNRGVVLRDLGQHALAVQSLERAIALRPGDPQPLNNLGLALKHLGRHQAAVECHDRGLAIDPGYAIGWYNRGLALRELGDPAAAMASHERAIALNPNAAEFHCDQGLALQDLGCLSEAIACFDRCIALQPDYPDAHWNKSLALLAQGDFTQGWRLYEWRWRNPKTGLRPADFRQPLWLGQEPLQGKSILLHAEQGLGDAIQFVRYARLVSALGASVSVQAPAPLFDLFEASADTFRVIRAGSDLSAFDYHCPLLSLPLAFGTTLASIPFRQGYLRADPLRLNHWTQRLGPAGQPRIGWVWSGNPHHNHDRQRSVPLAELLPWLPEGFEHVSLHNALRETDQATLEAHPAMRYVGAEIRDFADTAALCQLMDLVVSVDTSVAHLSGALGRRTHVLLPPNADWRWLLGRCDSPWYASVTLHRQARGEGWAPTLRQLGQTLTDAAGR